MGKISVPTEITVEGESFYLNIEKIGIDDAVTLTYEHQPIKEDSFLISAYGINLASATQKMSELLKSEKLY